MHDLSLDLNWTLDIIQCASLAGLFVTAYLQERYNKQMHAYTRAISDDHDKLVKLFASHIAYHEGTSHQVVRIDTFV